MVFEHDYKKFPELTNQQLQDFGFSSPHMQIETDFPATVVQVHDGDTVTLETGFRDFHFPLRLLDIDAPELNAGGEEAREWLKQRIEGNEVMIQIDRFNRVGKYGRLLGKIFSGGLDIGQELLLHGLAKPFKQREEGQLPNLGKIFRIEQWLR